MIMGAFVKIYQRFDLLQRSLSFCVAASVLVLVACGVTFGPLLVKSYDLLEVGKLAEAREVTRGCVSGPAKACI